MPSGGGETQAPPTSVVPDIRYTRRRDGDEQRATYFELFFDLVYVFAITQLSHHLLLDLTWAGAAQTAFLGLAVYWAWNYTTWMTNWFDPETAAVRLVLVFVMLASLLMAVAVPGAFGDRAVLFAASYAALQVGRNAFVVGVTPGGAFHRNFEQILAWSVLSTPFWVAGALAEDGARWALWLVALGLELVIAHPHDHLSAAGVVAVLGGPALYLLGVVVFGVRVGRHQAWPRVAVALVLLAGTPLATHTSGLTVAGLSAALLAALVAADHLGLGHDRRAAAVDE